MVKKLQFKMVLLLGLLLAGVSSVWATDVTFAYGDYKGNGTQGSGSTYTMVKEDVSIANSNFYGNNSYAHFYANGTTTITPGTGVTISKIVLTASTTSYNGYQNSGTITASTGSVSGSTSSTTVTWTGSATSAFTISNNKQIRWTSIVVTYSKSGGDTPSTYTVTYNGNGADSGSAPTDNTVYNADNNTVTVLGNTGNLAKTGYTFGGWNTQADGDGDDYDADDTFEISANTTLYAQWTANTHNVTLPTDDIYGTYTMSATTPVAYDTEVTLTYTPATGYENYQATWSVNGEAIAGNKFMMPDEAVTVTVSVERVTTINMTIDFENATNAYTDWTFTNITGKQTESGVDPHQGSYFGVTGATATASIVTTEKVNPVSLTCYVSKKSTNTTTSSWYIQVSEDGSTWRNVESVNGASMGKGEWIKLSADLSGYSDVYVRVYYSGSTAVRCIDDLVLTVQGGDEPMIIADGTLDLTFDATSGSIPYSIVNPVEGTNLTASVEAGCDWISNVTVGSESVTFTTTANEGAERSAVITLTYGEVTKDVTVTQAMLIVTNTYTLATSVVPGRHYIIVGGNKALGSQGGNNRAGVDITITNSQTSITSDKGVHELLLSIDSETGLFTLFDESTDEVNGGYLYAASNSSNYLRTQTTNDANGLWTIDFNEDENAILQAQGDNGRNLLQYNVSSGLFSCYASGQSAVYLYERVGDTGTQETTATINAACTDGTKYYGTFSAPFAFTVPSDVTVSEINIIDGELLVEDYAAEAVIPANTGVMISSSTAGEKLFTVVAEEGTSVLGNDNMLKASGAGIDADGMADAAPSCTYYRLTMHNGNEIGFWWGAEDGAAFDLDANKAYLAVPKSAGVRAGYAFFADDDAAGIAEIKSMSNGDNEKVYNLNGQRISKATKGLYIVNGKKMLMK